VTIKLEAESKVQLNEARKELTGYLNAKVLSTDDQAIWHDTLLQNGGAYNAMKQLDRRGNNALLIIREKGRRQPKYNGPPNHYEEVCEHIAAILAQLPTAMRG
jgi:hypothetical protein